MADPYAAQPELPAAPTIRQLMDHEPTWGRVVAAAREAGVAADEAVLSGRLERYLDFPHRDLVDAVTGAASCPERTRSAPGCPFSVRQPFLNSPGGHR